jgi:hypothetical protein
MLSIKRRRRIFINDDPLRRCYYGCFAKGHYEWGPFETLESSIPEDKVEGKLEFWRRLNEDAVACRGESARCEFIAENDNVKQ